MAFAAPILALSLRQGQRRLGSLGLLIVGIADNSLIPMPGSMDILTIWLAANERRYWPFYAAMATLGALLGGSITYELARRGGKEALERRKAKKQAQRLYRRFERWGFGAVAVPGHASASLSHGPLPAGRRCPAISAQEIPCRPRCRPCNPLHRHRCFGCSLWGHDRRLLCPILQTGARPSHRPGRRRLHFGSRRISARAQALGRASARRRSYASPLIVRAWEWRKPLAWARIARVPEDRWP